MLLFIILDKVSKLIEAFEYLHKFNQHGIKNQLRELPMIFMICGEILEIKGLKFVGEVLDLDAQTGGYNLQIAWTTGYVAGSTIKEGAN